MNDDLFNGKFSEEDYYPGIYNYCDNWCERCRFNSRCLNYSLSQNMEEEENGDEENNSLVRIKIIFEEVTKMLERFMEQEGIEINEYPNSDQQNEIELEKKVDGDPICILAERYLNDVHEWFSVHNEALEKFVANLHESIKLGIAEGDPVDDILSLHDVIDIITYYETFIYVKLKRALRSLYDEILDDEFKKMDKSLSAKLALIGIDRSVDAWKIMGEIVWDEKGIEASEFAVMLEELREMVEDKFPDAREFVRPYFD